MSLADISTPLLRADELHATPSRADGISAVREAALRAHGAQRCAAYAIVLRLPQATCAVGQVLFQRFFFCARRSFAAHDAASMALAALFVAAKAEETPRLLRDMVNAFHFVDVCAFDARAPSLDVAAERYWSIKERLVRDERLLLTELAFCVQVDLPHKLLLSYLKVLDAAPLAQRAWAFLNDAMCTPLPCRVRAEVIAVAAVFLAARAAAHRLPAQWWLAFECSRAQLDAAVDDILQLYALASDAAALETAKRATTATTTTTTATSTTMNTVDAVADTIVLS